MFSLQVKFSKVEILLSSEWSFFSSYEEIMHIKSVRWVTMHDHVIEFIFACWYMYKFMHIKSVWWVTMHDHVVEFIYACLYMYKFILEKPLWLLWSFKWLTLIPNKESWSCACAMSKIVIWTSNVSSPTFFELETS